MAGVHRSPSAGQSLRMPALSSLLCRTSCAGAFRADPGNAERCGAVLIFFDGNPYSSLAS